MAGDVVSATMFDVIAVAGYIGVSSLTGPAFVSIALFISGVVSFKSERDLITDLPPLSLVSTVWSCRWRYNC
jgi:hypothetical protein